MTYISAVIVAAGSSARMGGEDKQMIKLCGVPVLARTMLAFEKCEAVSEIVVVTRKQNIEAVQSFAKAYRIGKLTKVVEGGKTRAESVRNGVYAISEKAGYVAIQDGARPLVTSEEIIRCAKDAVLYGGAMLAVPVTNTVKFGEKNGFVEYTPEREKLFAAQTPQIFSVEAYKSAMERAFEEQGSWTDDSMIFERDGRKVFLTEGSRSNIKITSPEDIIIAEAILKGREQND